MSPSDELENKTKRKFHADYSEMPVKIKDVFFVKSESLRNQCPLLGVAVGAESMPIQRAYSAKPVCLASFFDLCYFYTNTKKCSNVLSECRFFSKFLINMTIRNT